MIASATNSPGTAKRWERTQSEVYLKRQTVPLNLGGGIGGDSLSSSDESLSEANHLVADRPKV